MGSRQRGNRDSMGMGAMDSMGMGAMDSMGMRHTLSIQHTT